MNVPSFLWHWFLSPHPYPIISPYQYLITNGLTLHVCRAILVWMLPVLHGNYNACVLHFDIQCHTIFVIARIAQLSSLIFFHQAWSFHMHCHMVIIFTVDYVFKPNRTVLKLAYNISKSADDPLENCKSFAYYICSFDTSAMWTATSLQFGLGHTLLHQWT